MLRSEDTQNRCIVTGDVYNVVFELPQDLTHADGNEKLL